MEEKKIYTAGELGRLTGVSARTIRFYDKKALLKPVGYSDSGYRLYNQESSRLAEEHRASFKEYEQKLKREWEDYAAWEAEIITPLYRCFAQSK